MADITSGLVAHWKLDETSGTSAADSSRVSAGPFSDTDYLSASAVTFNTTSTEIRVRFTHVSGGTNQSLLSQGYIQPFAVRVNAGNGLEVQHRKADTGTTNTNIGTVVVGASYDLTINIKSLTDEIIVTDNNTGALSGTFAADLQDAPTTGGTFYVGRYASTGYGATGKTISRLTYTLNGTPTHDWEFTKGLGDQVGATTLSETGSVTRPFPGTHTNSPTLNQDGAFGGSKSVAFTGASSHKVTLGSTTLLKNKAEVSISSWVKWSTGSEQGVVNVAGAGSTARLSLHVNYSGNGNIRLGARAGDAEALQAVLTSSNSFGDGAWHHVVGTINYATDSILLYVDGVAVSTTGTPAFTATATSNTDSPLTRIGCGVFDSLYFTGSVDDVRLYDRILAPSEVAALYVYNAVRFTTLNLLLPARYKKG